MTMQAHGVDSLVTSLHESADAMRRADDLADAAADVIRDVAKPRTPKRTGALMATVRTDAGRVVAGGRSVAYAGVIHWGSKARNIKAQPWIAEAAHSAEGRAIDAIQDSVVEIVERIRGQ